MRCNSTVYDNDGNPKLALKDHEVMYIVLPIIMFFTFWVIYKNQKYYKTFAVLHTPASSLVQDDKTQHYLISRLVYFYSAVFLIFVCMERSDYDYYNTGAMNDLKSAALLYKYTPIYFCDSNLCVVFASACSFFAY